MLAAARATYERIQQEHPKHDVYPQATFERAKVLALQKDVNGAMNELKKFSADPLTVTRLPSESDPDTDPMAGVGATLAKDTTVSVLATPPSLSAAVSTTR